MVLFLAAHLASLPRAFDDIDSINFALGVRDFDVARHQPHPPGYPVFIALGRVSTAAFHAAGAGAAAVYGLALWSAIGGAVLLLSLFAFSRSVFLDDEPALLSTALVAATPLFWFSALRPLSDVAGLAAAFASLAAVSRAVRGDPPGRDSSSTRLLIAGAFAAGLSVGFRSQMALLTLPLLGFVVLRSRVPSAVRVWTLAALALGIVVWGAPLVMASGGPADYLRALGSQAGEDFSGVVMLWTHRTARVAALAALNSFMLPWDSPVLAGIVLSLAAAGVPICCVRSPRNAGVLALVFGPYLVFHLLFQETVTTRYALPLVPLVAMLVALVLAQAHRYATIAAAAALIAAGLLLAVPAGAAFARTPSPIFAALGDMNVSVAPGRPPLVGMHRRVWTESRRARQWSGGLPGRLLESPRSHEWLEVTRAWRAADDSETWFLADPRRTDLALIDSEFRRTREYRWPFDAAVYVGGARPNEVDWHIYDRPGWFLEEGWALTPEIAGITERDGWGPHRKPSVGWVRRQPVETVLMLGGRHLGAPAEPPVTLDVALDDRGIAALEARPGFFLHFLRVSSEALAGEGRFARLTVAARPSEPGPTAGVSLEQFNLQSSDVVQFGFADGWYEPEYNPRTAQSWRWMSGAAALQIHHAGRSVAIRIHGESPRRYYPRPQGMRVTAAGRTLAALAPEDDFVLELTVPADLLAAARGRVLLESSDVFVPADRDGTADRRRLAHRIYSVRVRGTVP